MCGHTGACYIFFGQWTSPQEVHPPGDRSQTVRWLRTHCGEGGFLEHWRAHQVTCSGQPACCAQQVPDSPSSERSVSPLAGMPGTGDSFQVGPREARWWEQEPRQVGCRGQGTFCWGGLRPEKGLKGVSGRQQIVKWTRSPGGKGGRQEGKRDC